MTQLHNINRPFLAAAALLFATAGIHAFVGGPEINRPVQQSALDPVVRSVVAVIWHAITALALVLGGAMIWSARFQNRALVLTVLAINLSFAALFVLIGWSALSTLWPMPQWVIFLTISAVLLWGLRVSPVQA